MAPLVPNQDQWPLFDELAVGNIAALPPPPSRSSSRNKNPDHIPRPRNAFMLFRSAFAAAQKISSTVEHDNRHITRIIAHCWHRLSDAEKQVWRDRAAAEKAQHAQRYPNYRFSPVVRTNRPVKRNVRRNGADDVKRCETLAELVMSGKHGLELESAIKKFDEEHMHVPHVPSSPDAPNIPPPDVAPFRSPLLPPNPQASDENLLAQPLVPHVEPLMFYPSTVDSAFDGLFAPPSYQYYHANAPSDVPCPRTVPSPDRIMDFVQLEQSVPDLTTLFAWNQSDNFSYYH